MKKSVITTFILSVLVPTGLVLFFLLANHSESTTTKTIANISSFTKMGKASFDINHASAVDQSLSVLPTVNSQSVPTNKWFENAVVASAFPEPLFNLPLSTTLGTSGITVGIPKVSASANTISAPASTDLTLTPLTPASKALLDTYDDASVLIDGVTNSNGDVYKLRLTKGIPFVFAELNTGVTIDSTNFSSHSITDLKDGRSVLRISTNGNQYAVYVPTSAKMRESGNTISINQTDQLVIAGLPSNADATVQSDYDGAAKATVSGSKTAYSVTGSEASTTISYTTPKDTTSIIALLPNQVTGMKLDAKDIIGSIQTVRGTAKLIKGNSFTYQATVPSSQLVLTKPTDGSFYNDKTERGYLAADAKNIETSSGSYDGGKELFRLANLLMIAEQLKDPTAATFKAKLQTELQDWLTYTPGETGKYFYYDKTVHGLVAVEPQYGSDTFNDHHFHYGYFLYAASMLATYDPSFVTNYGEAMDYVAQDIASEGNSLFPRLRTYDVYEGHSWAGGLSPFSDGNDQESTSEAINAWYALDQWATIRKDTSLQTRAQWLYANETNDALTYNYQNTANPFPAGYSNGIVSLIWGGKAEYNTFFSTQDESKHAILMLPLSGGSQYLKTNNAIGNSIADLDSDVAPANRQSYQDILMLGESLSNAKTAEALFSPSMSIDNSNSLSYLYYYLGWAQGLK